MSVRKRQWFTRQQIGAWEREGRAKDDLFKALCDNNEKVLKLYPPQEAWVANFTDQHGKRRLKTFDKKKDADAFHSTATVEVRHGVHTSSKATVAKAAEKWIEDAEDRLEPATVESYRQHLDQHIKPYLGAVKLSQLTVPVVRDFMDRLRADKRSPAMVKRVVGDLGAILADAQERGLVAQNVVRSLSRKKRHDAERRQKPKLKVGVDIPTPAEIRTIIAHLSGRWRPLVLTAIFTGLRASELRGLVWDDVDLKKAELHVRQRADRFNSIGMPKSASGQRTVPMPPILVNTLREWKLVCPKSEIGLVFPTGAGGVENHSNIVQRGLGPVQIAAGVVNKDGTAKYTGLHALRHFYASWLINRKEDGGLGLPLKVVQHRLGHSSIQMTADVYGHLFPSGDDGAELDAAATALVG
jgi:integrase